MKSYIIEDTHVRIAKLIPGGQALATLPDGKKAFFWNALPGEIVTSYQVTKSKSSYLEATALTITNQSPHRIPPRDNCYLSTSPWQIMDYDYELQQKVALVKECFRQAGVESGPRLSAPQGSAQPTQEALAGAGGAAWGTPTPAQREARAGMGENAATGPATLGNDRCPDRNVSAQTDNRTFHYRNKMEYSLYWDNSTGEISLAFHARGSHRKIPIASSSLERPEILTKAREIIANLNARGEEARRYQSPMLRCDQQGHVSGGLFENGQPHPDFPSLTDCLLGHQYTYSPNGFFQINLPVYELALREIAQHINTRKVLDLYAGVGTIGLSVARDRELTLVEVNKAAYAELFKNCANVTRTTLRDDGERGSKEPRNDGRDAACRESNVRAVCSTSENALDFITPDETVILDPPRAGCHPRLLAKLTEQTPPTIIYLSCNPITQARDLRFLSQKYKITEAQTFNFFPRTPHIENLIVLGKT